MAKEYAENSVEVPKTEQNLHTVQPCLCSCVCTCSTAVMTMSTAARVGVRMPAKAHASGNTSNVRITVCATRLDECETSLCSDSTVSQCAPREQHEQQPQHQQRGTLCRLYTAHTRTSSSVLIFLVLSFFACSPSSTYAFVSLTSSPTVAYRRYILNKRLPRFASSRGGGGGDGKDAGSYPHDRTLMLLKTPPPPCSPLQPLKLQQRNRHRLLLPALAAGASGGNDDSRDTCGTNAGAHTTMQKSSVAGGDDCGSVARVAIGQEAETRGGAEAAKQLQGIGGSSGGATQQKRRKRKEKDLVRVFTVAEMDELLAGGASLFDLDARGQSQKMLEGRQDEHPVLEVLRKRAAAGTVAGSHGDGLKVSFGLGNISGLGVGAFILRILHDSRTVFEFNGQVG